MFLERLAHSLWEPWWAKRILSSKYRGSLLCSLIAAFDHKGEGTEVSSRCCRTTPLPSDFQGELMGQHLFSFPSFFFSFLFRSQTLETRILKKQLHVQGKLESDCICPAKSAEKTWEELKLTSLTDAWHRHSLQQPKKKRTTAKMNKPWERGRIWSPELSYY